MQICKMPCCFVRPESIPDTGGSRALPFAAAAAAFVPPPPPRKRARPCRISDADVAVLDLELEPESRAGPAEEESGSVLEQLAAVEAAATAAAGAVELRAAGVREGRGAGMVHIEVCLPGAADDCEQDHGMGLIDPSEGF